MSEMRDSSGEPLPPPLLEGGARDSPPKFPLAVRILAVAYVVSWIVGPVGFFLLSGVGSFLWERRRQVDGLVLSLWLGGVLCLSLCAAFRWWFRRWGRRRWPDVEAGAGSDTHMPPSG
jgi:uncharacterized membrane protein YbhN (UPF0104 family)